LPASAAAPRSPPPTRRRRKKKTTTTDTTGKPGVPSNTLSLRAEDICARNPALKESLVAALGEDAMKRSFPANEKLPFRIEPKHIPPLPTWNAGNRGGGGGGGGGGPMVIPQLEEPTNIPAPPPFAQTLAASFVSSPSPPDCSSPMRGPALRHSLPPSFIPTLEEAATVRHCFHDLEISIGRYRESRALHFEAFLARNPEYPVVLSALPFAAAEQILYAAVHHGSRDLILNENDDDFVSTTLGKLVCCLGEKWAVAEVRRARESRKEGSCRTIHNAGSRRNTREDLRLPSSYVGVEPGAWKMSARRLLQLGTITPEEKEIIDLTLTDFFALADGVLGAVLTARKVFECVYLGRDRAEQKYRDRRIFSWRPLPNEWDWTTCYSPPDNIPFIFTARPCRPHDPNVPVLDGPDSGHIAQWVIRRFEDYCEAVGGGEGARGAKVAEGSPSARGGKETKGPTARGGKVAKQRAGQENCGADSACPHLSSPPGPPGPPTPPSLSVPGAEVHVYMLPLQESISHLEPLSMIWTYAEIQAVPILVLFKDVKMHKGVVRREYKFLPAPERRPRDE